MPNPLPEICERCKYRGFLDTETQYACCDYLYVTGHPRSSLPPREDGLCPGFEEGKREYSRIVQNITNVKQEPRPMKYDGELMRRVYDRGGTDGEIAAATGCSKSTVVSWRRRNGLPPNPAPPVEPWYDREVLMALYRKGYSDKRISMLIGCSATTVGRWRAKNNLPMVKVSITKPERFERETMRELYEKGMNDKQIADAIGCGPSTVQRWRIKEGLVAHRFLKGEKKK